MLLNFLVCFGPYNVSHAVGHTQGESPKWRSSVLPLNTLNSCVDTLYYFSSSGFQADFQGLPGRLTGACGPWWQEGSVTLKSEGEGPPQELSNIQGGSGAGGQVDWPAEQIIPGAVPSSSQVAPWRGRLGTGTVWVRAGTQP